MYGDAWYTYIIPEYDIIIHFQCTSTLEACYYGDSNMFNTVSVWLMQQSDHDSYPSAASSACQEYEG